VFHLFSLCNFYKLYSSHIRARNYQFVFLIVTVELVTQIRTVVGAMAAAFQETPTDLTISLATRTATALSNAVFLFQTAPLALVRFSHHYENTNKGINFVDFGPKIVELLNMYRFYIDVRIRFRKLNVWFWRENDEIIASSFGCGYCLGNGCYPGNANGPYSATVAANCPTWTITNKCSYSPAEILKPPVLGGARMTSRGT
jgi:hypothetical protein